MSSQIATDALYIQESSADFGCRHVVRDSTGKRYVIYIDESGDLQVKSSTDGTSWSADTSFGPGSGLTLTYPTICVGKDDDIYVAYREGNLSNYTIKVEQRAHSGGAWTEILSWDITIYGTQTVPNLSSGITASKYLTDRIYIFIAYQSAATTHIIQNKYTDNKGSAWTDGTDLSWTVSSGEKDCYIWDIDTYNNGNVILIMRSYYTVYKCIFNSTGGSGAKTSVTGGSDGGSILIDNNDNLRWITLDYTSEVYSWDNNMFPGITTQMRRGSVSMGVDGDNNVYIFYTKAADDKAYYYKWTRSTETWSSSPTLLSTNKGDRVKCEQRALSTSTKLCVVYFSDV